MLLAAMVNLRIGVHAYYKVPRIMAIKLRVISEQYRELGEHRSRVFGVNGGSIGRAPDNDWVLPDPKRLVSGHHCDIEYRSGGFWLTDKSTNGVYVNDAEAPASETGRVALQDGDRLRMGDYEILVSVDERIDFLPAASELHSAEKHLDADIGADFSLDSLLTSHDPDESSGSISVRNAFGLKVPKQRRDGVTTDDEASARDDRGSGSTPDTPAEAGPPADWAMKTRAITRQELAEARARRQSRMDARQQTLPFHRQATAWEDLNSALQAFCRGAGIDLSRLSEQAQSMLPLVAGQLLREAVVGLVDLQQARATAGPAAASALNSQTGGSNPLRNSASVDQALTRLFESQGRVYGGPVDALRDVLLDAKEHEAALNAGLRAGLDALLGQLAPTNVADQFEQGRARSLAPGQDPRPKYWEHYAELFRMITQNSVGGIPHPFIEAFLRAYEDVRGELASKRKLRGES
jgi:type VI secretion system FHA domain protein